jgi:hypothetical protein
VRALKDDITGGESGEERVGRKSGREMKLEMEVEQSCRVRA